MISKREGDWWITSPLYVGDKADLTRMMLCQHAAYEEKTETRVEDTKDGQIEMQLQRCVGCDASRVRYRWLDPERNRRA